MNNHLYRVFVLLLIGLCSGTVMAANLSVVHSGQWPPYSGQELPEQGLAVDLVATALKRAGYSPKIRVDSLDRILEGGKIGVYDVFATPWFSDDRNEYLLFSKPYLESYIRFIKQKDADYQFDDLDDLEGKMIGVVAGYAYSENFNHSRDVIRISERNLIQNILKLTQGRIDLALDDELVLRYEINRFMPSNMASLEILAKPLAVRGIHIGVSRENPDHERIVADFDKAISEMKKDGTYDKILNKHKANIEKPAN